MAAVTISLKSSPVSSNLESDSVFPDIDKHTDLNISSIANELFENVNLLASTQEPLKSKLKDYFWTYIAEKFENGNDQIAEVVEKFKDLLPVLNIPLERFYDMAFKHCKEAFFRNYSNSTSVFQYRERFGKEMCLRLCTDSDTSPYYKQALIRTIRDEHRLGIEYFQTRFKEDFEALQLTEAALLEQLRPSYHVWTQRLGRIDLVVCYDATGKELLGFSKYSVKKSMEKLKNDEDKKASDARTSSLEATIERMDLELRLQQVEDLARLSTDSDVELGQLRQQLETARTKEVELRDQYKEIDDFRKKRDAWEQLEESLAIR